MKKIKEYISGKDENKSINTTFDMNFTDNYEEKMKSLLEGLEIQNLDLFMEYADIESHRKLGIAYAEASKKLKKQNEQLIECLIDEVTQSQQDFGNYSLKSANLLADIKQKTIEDIIDGK